MKKVILVLLMILVSGCFGINEDSKVDEIKNDEVKDLSKGEKHLSCRYESDSEGGVQNTIEYLLVFENDKPKRSERTTTIKYLDATTEQMESNFAYYEMLYMKFNVLEGVVASTKLVDNKIYQTMTIDKAQADFSEFEEDMGFLIWGLKSSPRMEEMTLEEQKSGLVYEGMICD